MLTEYIKSLYDEATGRWSGAEWTHQLVTDGDWRLGSKGDPVYCDGQFENCDTCAEAEEYASSAEEYAIDAMDALRRGDIDAAYEAARECRGCEDRFGDAPTWGPFADAIIAMHTEIRGNWRLP